MIKLLILIFFILLIIMSLLINEQKTGGDDKQYMVWNHELEIYPSEMMHECVKIVNSIDGFGMFTDKDLEDMKNISKQLIKKYGVEITQHQLNSIRNIELAEKSRKVFKNIFKVKENIKKDLENNMNILAISEKYNIPPMQIVKQFNLNEFFEKEDINSKYSGSVINKQAKTFEKQVEELLRKNNISFKTEDDFRNEKSQGLTPDFYFEIPLEINNTVIHWMDVKNYPMYDSPLLLTKVVNQIKKYTKEFGFGAVLFNGGVLKNSKIFHENALVLTIIFD